MTYLNQAHQLYNMVNQGQILDAFEKYYHDDVVMIEATGHTRKGKAENREYEKKFVSSVKQVHGGGVHAITSDEKSGITMVESWMDVSFADGNRVKMEQVAVQKWDGDKIIHERFYYNPS